jgi:magnesium transporter
MIEYYKKVVKEKPFQKLKQFTSNSWVDVVNPDEEEVNTLVERFRLDKDLVLDGLDVHEIPRVEEEDGKVYIYLRAATSRVADAYTSSFLVILGKDFFMTISRTDLELFDLILQKRKDFLTNDKTDFLSRILSILSNDYNNKVRSILKQVRKEKRQIIDLNNKDILNLVLQEDILNDYISSFGPLISLHTTLIKKKSLRFDEDEREMIEDLVIDLGQTYNSCKAALRTITNRRDYYSTALSNNLNKIITILTVFTIFLTIPAVLAGIYGMNIALPFQGHPKVFWLLAGIVG